MINMDLIEFVIKSAMEWKICFPAWGFVTYHILISDLFSSDKKYVKSVNIMWNFEAKIFFVKMCILQLSFHYFVSIDKYHHVTRSYYFSAAVKWRISVKRIWFWCNVTILTFWGQIAISLVFFPIVLKVLEKSITLWILFYKGIHIF